MGTEPSLVVFAVAAVAFLVVLLVADFRSYAFVVRIVDGSPVVRRGKVTATFLEQVREVCAEYGVRKGWLGGVRRGRRTRLVFSRSIPESCRQRLRNVWMLEG